MDPSAPWSSGSGMLMEEVKRVSAEVRNDPDEIREPERTKLSTTTRRSTKTCLSSEIILAHWAAARHRATPEGCG